MGFIIKRVHCIFIFASFLSSKLIRGRICFTMSKFFCVRVDTFMKVSSSCEAKISHKVVMLWQRTYRGANDMYLVLQI